MLNERLKKFRKRLTELSLDAAIYYRTDLVEDKSVEYLVGKKFNPAVLFVFPKRKPVLYVSPLDKLTEKDLAELDGISVKVIKKGVKFYDSLKGEKRIGVNGKILPFSMVQSVKKSIKKDKGYVPRFVDCSVVEEMRILKDSLELSHIKKAVAITESIFEKAFLNFKSKKFIFEQDVVKFLKFETIMAGCELAFEPVVASGKNSANPHYYSAPLSKLKKGFCVIDFGVKYNGYSSDITRTIYLGKPSRDEIRSYEKVCLALNYCQREIKEGMTVKDVFDSFSKTNFGMIHALGHGIGLDVHEFPILANGGDELIEGMVLAIEPAEYFKSKFGIRVEDDFLVTKKGLICLCKLSRDLRTFKN